MSSRAYNKAKGAEGERRVAAAYLVNGNPYAAVEPRHGRYDKGDTGGVDYITTEVKVEKDYAGKLAGWLAEAERERQNAGTDLGVVWHKKRGTTDPLRWYVTMEGATWLQASKGYQEWRRLKSPLTKPKSPQTPGSFSA